MTTRGSWTSFFDLPADEQRRLAPMLDEWFGEEHRARLEKLGL